MKTESKSRTGFTKKLGSVIRGSVIISALDRFCLWVYSMLGSGLFARIFSGGANKASSEKDLKIPSSHGKLSRLRQWVSKKIENSFLVTKLNSAASVLLSCRLRVIGTYLMTFAAYTCIFAAVLLFLTDTTAERYNAYTLLVEALTVGAVSVPFLVSKMTVSKAICSSSVCNKIINSCGFSKNKLRCDEVSGRHAVAFVLGILSGIATFAVSAFYIFAAFLVAVFVYAVFALPEFGVMCLFFAAPLAPTSLLIVLVVLVALAFIIKVIRAKRALTFRRVDLFVAALAVLIIFGGLVSFSSESLIPSFIYVTFIVGYFLVSCCVRSAEWLRRCTVAAIWSGLIVAFYGILQYVFAGTFASVWIDSDLFEGISGRAVSTLENPNMLGEYLIMILPMALATWISGKGMSRKSSFVAFACLGMCLILTWSRGAWLGFLLAIIVFLLIWNRRAMWLVVAGVISLPFLSFVLPDTVVSRFTSIGNLADSSTSYRVNIWRGAMHMARDHLFTGIGVGEGAWREIYPDYTLPGIEAAPHSHNLFIQITIETGIFGILFFIIILILLAKLAFTLFSRFGSAETVGLEKDFSLDRKLAVAGPLCGLFAVLIQGLTDNSWYNYRVFLMFWLMIGLIPAFVKSTNAFLDSRSCDTYEKSDSAEEASVDIRLSQQDAGR